MVVVESYFSHLLHRSASRKSDPILSWRQPRYTARGVPEMKGADPLTKRRTLSALVTARRKREDKLAPLRPIIRAGQAGKPQTAKAAQSER